MAGKDFVTQALQMRPDKRPSIKELIAHPWITTHCKRTANLESLGQMSVSEQKGNAGWLQLLKNINESGGTKPEVTTAAAAETKA